MGCKFCNKDIKNPGSLKAHEMCCKFNSMRIKHRRSTNSGSKKGSIPWNKGLTKETDIRVLNNALAVSQSTKGKPSKTIWTDEMKKAKSEWRKKLHKDFPETHPNRRLAGNRNKMTYPERVAFDFLTKMNVQFKHQIKISNFFPDFVIGDVIIEIDGAKWHNKEKDRNRDQILESLGYKVFRIDSKDKIEEKIKDILGLG